MSSPAVAGLNRATTLMTTSSQAPIAPNPSPQVSNPSVASVAMYYVPRRFEADSKLHSYLSLKTPGIVSPLKTDYNLYEVLLALKRIIANEKLFDPQNPTVILCDAALEEALDVKALHVSEIREQVCKQFHPVLRAETVSSLTTNGSTSASPLQHLGVQSPNLSNQNASSIQNQNKVNSNNPVQPTPTTNPNPDHSTENRLTRCATAPEASQVTPELIMVLPSWASNTANAVMARLSPTGAFDIEGRYWVKPDFLKVLRAVEGVSQTQVVFPYREVTNILSKYIMLNKDRFFDLRNIRIALVENDLLGKAFGVKAFARSQVTSLLRAQLIPYTEQLQTLAVENNSKDDDDKLIIKRKQISDEGSDSTSDVASTSRSSFTNVAKRNRRRSSNVPFAILDYSCGDSSGEETIYSAQGYETTAICDDVISDDSDEGKSASASSDVNPSSSPSRRQNDDEDEYCEENIYRVEYEIGSGSDEENEKARKDRDGSSAEDSDIEDVLIASAVTTKLNDMESSDFANWADSDSECSSDDSGSDFVLSNYDPELQDGVDTWNCVNCGQPNTPYMRYCHRCWEERKGWVPERAKPRRRKKEKKSGKKTEGIPLKNNKYRSETNEGQSVEMEACFTTEIRLERSLSNPCDVLDKFDKNVLKLKAVSDGEGEEKDGPYESQSRSTGTKSVESVGASSQSSDSGISSQDSQENGSQEILTPEFEKKGATKNEVEIVKRTSSSLKSKISDDSLNSELSESNGEMQFLTQKKRRKGLKLDFSKKRKFSGGSSNSQQLSSRRDELPKFVRQQNRAFQSSVCDTPDTDANTPTCSSSLTQTQTLSVSNPASLCNMCCVRAKDACFVHGQISHQVCCYPCAKMIFKNRGTCPVCRRRIEKITRNIVV